MTSLIARAARLAIAAHDSIDQVRKYTGAPYWMHPLAVAADVRRHKLSEEAVAAACLHDVLEDVTPLNPRFNHQLIFDQCGHAVLNLVYECTKASKPSDGNRAARQAIDRAHFARASYEGQGIKLADLIDNTRDIAANDRDFSVTFLAEKELLLPMMLNAPPALMAEAWEAVARTKEFLYLPRG